MNFIEEHQNEFFFLLILVFFGAFLYYIGPMLPPQHVGGP